MAVGSFLFVNFSCILIHKVPIANAYTIRICRKWGWNWVGIGVAKVEEIGCVKQPVTFSKQTPQ